MDNNRIENVYIDDDNSPNGNIDCGSMVVGMAYVPIQEWNKIYEPSEALSRGTQFPELDKPFFGEVIR